MANFQMVGYVPRQKRRLRRTVKWLIALAWRFWTLDLFGRSPALKILNIGWLFGWLHFLRWERCKRGGRSLWREWRSTGFFPLGVFEKWMEGHSWSLMRYWSSFVQEFRRFRMVKCIGDSVVWVVKLCFAPVSLLILLHMVEQEVVLIKVWKFTKVLYPCYYSSFSNIMKLLSYFL